MVKVWSFEHDFQVRRGSLRVFVLLFQKEEQLSFILNDGYWAIDNNLEVFSRWLADRASRRLSLLL